jgi:hypothetical protein
MNLVDEVVKWAIALLLSAAAIGAWLTLCVMVKNVWRMIKDKP